MQAALSQRLKEIEMSEYEFSLYEKIVNNVSREIRFGSLKKVVLKSFQSNGDRSHLSQLRVILEGVEAKKQERVWLSNKTSGELDDR